MADDRERRERALVFLEEHDFPDHLADRVSLLLAFYDQENAGLRQQLVSAREALSQILNETAPNDWDGYQFVYGSERQLLDQLFRIRDLATAEPKKISLGDGKAIRETEKALLVRLDSGEEKWIPKSVVHDDSEVYELGNCGDVVVAEWWAEKEGLA